MFSNKEKHVTAERDKPALEISSSNESASNDPFRSGKTINGRWLIEKTIGKGSYGRVKRARDLHNNYLPVALKFISKASIRKPQHTVRIQREIALMRAMQHEHIAKLYERIDTDTDIILVMEYVDGGDLYERISSSPNYRLSEREARPLFRQIVSALDYCHQHCIIHRDIKPENVMLAGPKDRNAPVDQLCIKLIDFGFANLYDPTGHLQTNCGSPLYAAPEIINGAAYTGPEVDLWSLGVTLFAMLTGTLPFEDEQLKGLYAKILAGKFSMPGYLSPSARDLISLMLRVDPQQRASMQVIKHHPWTCKEIMDAPLPLYHHRDAFFAYGKQFIDNEIVEEMLHEYAFHDRDSVIRDIMNRRDSPAHAIYSLLADRKRQQQYKQPAIVERGIMSPPLTPVKSVGSAKSTKGIGNRLASSVVNHFRKLRGIDDMV